MILMPRPIIYWAKKTDYTCRVISAVISWALAARLDWPGVMVLVRLDGTIFLALNFFPILHLFIATIITRYLLGAVRLILTFSHRYVTGT